MLDELIKESPALLVLSLLFMGFLAGLAAYKAILGIARLKVISLHQWESVRALIAGGADTANSNEVSALNAQEATLLRELVVESKGIGDSVAVYPFESNINRLDISTESASLSIAALQERGFVSLGKEAGWGDLKDKATTYPVYRVTKEGFRWAIQHRS